MVLCLGLLSFSLGLAYFVFRIRRFLSNSHLFFLGVDVSKMSHSFHALSYLCNRSLQVQNKTVERIQCKIEESLSTFFMITFFVILGSIEKPILESGLSSLKIHFQCSLCIIRPLYGLIRCLSSSMPITSDRIRYFQYWLDLVTSLSTDTIQLLNNVSSLKIAEAYKVVGNSD